MQIEDWIRWYIKEGINVIPLREREKTPLIAWEEFKRRSATDSEVEEWLSRGIKNFGAICGSISNDLLVIDVDQEELFSGLNLGELANETFTVRTGKGYHIYLRMPDPKKRGFKWKEREEIRFQGEGKYVVCAGSQHPSGKIYKQFNTSPREIKSAEPQHLLDEIEQRWKRYHNIDKLEEKREEISRETKRSSPLENFKRKVGISSIVGEYVSKANDYGTYWQGYCPFHDDRAGRTPSFTVYEDSQCYHCFGCERHGDAITFIREKEGKGFKDAIKRIEEITGVEYFKKSTGMGKDETSKKSGRREIKPSEVDAVIRAERDFITLRDTEEVLHYENSAGGAWRFNAEALIREETEKILEKWGEVDSASRYFASEVLGHVQRSTYVDREVLNTEKKKINLLNGVYDLETEDLLPHSMSYYFTYLIPVDYDPDADCPSIKKFLNEILYEDDIQTVLQFVGYCMLPIMPYHRSLMLLGEGANGKSTLIELIRSFLGKKNTSSHSFQSILEERFTKSDLYGRLANLYADIPRGSLRNTGIFKVLTGGDYLSAEKKFKDFFSFQNTAKLIFSANVLPPTLDDTDAFFRRWLIITLPNKFEGERCDPKILDRLTTPEEFSGFLNLVIGALKQLLRDDSFHKSKATEEIREEYIDKSNPVQSFVLNCLEYDPQSFETKDDLFAAFVKYCSRKKLPSTSKRQFGTYLPQYLPVKGEYKRLRGKRVHCWRGARFKEKKRYEEFKNKRVESEGEDEQEYPLKDSSKEKKDSSEEEIQVVSSSLPLNQEIKSAIFSCLSSIPIDPTIENLRDVVFIKTEFSHALTEIMEHIERMIKEGELEKKGDFVKRPIQK